MSPAAALYAVNVVYTAVLAGFMISYVVTMGSFFTHTLSHGRRRELQRLLLPFNRDEHVSARYAAWVLGQVVVAAVSLALNAGRSPLAAQIFAVAAMPLWYAMHVGSRFARTEHLAEGGPEDVPEREIKRFLRLNLPIHCGYAAVYVAAALWLLAGLLQPARRRARRLQFRSCRPMMTRRPRRRRRRRRKRSISSATPS